MYLKHKKTGDCVRIDNLNDWEVVPETAKPLDHWQDVTGKCRVDSECIVHDHDEGPVQIYIPVIRHGYNDEYRYRLRKVRCNHECYKGEQNVTRWGDGWAFLVERKVSD